MKGTLYGLGVGPGDPELITLKALRILERTSVLAYPAPEEGESLVRGIVADHLDGRHEEIGRMAEHHAVEVVPGVSSLMACAATLGAPLAARNDVLSVVPATLANEALERRIRDVDAVAIIKVGRHLPRVRAVIDAMGLTENARYVEHATMASEKILPLAEVAEGTAPYFSMILLHARGDAWKA